MKELMILTRGTSPDTRPKHKYNIFLQATDNSESFKAIALGTTANIFVDTRARDLITVSNVCNLVTFGAFGFGTEPTDE